MGDLDLAELRRLLAEATPGPWLTADHQVDDSNVPRTIVRLSDDGGVLVDVGLNEIADCDFGENTKADVRLIAAAVNSLGPLLDELERLRGELVKVNEDCRIRLDERRRMQDAAEAALYRRDGITHSDECWRWHLGCAVRRVEEVTQDRDEWRDACRDANSRFKRAEDALAAYKEPK